MRHLSLAPRRLLSALAPLALPLLLVGAFQAPTVAAAIVPNPEPESIEVWQPCEPGTGVTVVVDRRALGDGAATKPIDVRCALGPQQNGWTALHNAGFEIEGLAGGIGFACRIGGLPAPADEPCILTPGFDSYWSYWHGKPGGRWGYSGVGALSPSSAAPVDSVQGWGFAGVPRIQPMNGSGPSSFTLPPAQQSSVVAAVHARDWLTGVVLETVRQIGDGTLPMASDSIRDLLAQAATLVEAGVDPGELAPVAELLGRHCDVDGEDVGACPLWLGVNSTRIASGWDRSSPAYVQALRESAVTERYAAAVLGLGALGQDPSDFEGEDLRGALLDLIDEATGKVSRQGNLQDAVDYTAPTVEALLLTGTLPEKATKTVGLIVAKQNATTGGFSVGSITHVLGVRALAAAREAGVTDLDEPLARAGAFLESLQQPDGALRRRASASASFNPTLESTAAGAVGLALTGRAAAAERATKWVSRFQVTPEYAGSPDPGSGDQPPAYPLIGAFLTDENGLRNAIVTGLAPLFAEAQPPTRQALEALAAAGPFGPYYLALDEQSLWFDTQFVGSTSAPRSVTLTNHDERAITIAGAHPAGEQAGSFEVDAADCVGATLASGESCAIAATFSPKVAGGRHAIVHLTIGGASQAVILSLGGAAVATADQDPDPRTVPEPPRAARPPEPPAANATGSIDALKGARAVGPGRIARLAMLSCPQGSRCRVTAPRRVRIRIAGRRYTVAILVPRAIAPGRTAALRVRLSKAAARRLSGRRSVVRVPVALAAQGQISRTLELTLAGAPLRTPQKGRSR
jgi:hypothetical protein